MPPAKRAAREGLTNGLARPPPRGSGRTNGLVNGLGKTNGLVNGLGRTNGLVNGLGRTNGLVNGLLRPKDGNGRGRTNGLVNGTGYVNGLSLRQNRFGIVTHRDLRRGAALIAVAVVATILFGILMSSSEPASRPFVVDGLFGEWSAVAKYADPSDSASAYADLLESSVHADPGGGRLFVYGHLRGPLFTTSTATSVFAFLNDSGPGYAAAPGFDAAYVAELWGWDGELRGTSLRHWSGGGDRDNATALEGLGGISGASAGAEFELVFTDPPIDLANLDGVTVLVGTRADAEADTGAIMTASGGALVVTQEPLTTSITGPSPIFRVTFTAYGADVRVGGLTVSRGPGILRLPTFPFWVPRDTTHVENLTLDPTGLVDGTFLRAHVEDVDASVNRDTGPGTRVIRATVAGDGARAYFGNRPAGKAVDGLFGDWASETDPPEGLPANVEILNFNSTLQAGAFFYLNTSGRILAGAVLPEQHLRPPGGNGTSGTGPVFRLRSAGEDVLRAYVDADDRDTAGFAIGGIEADRLVEVRGRLGRITSRTLSVWNESATSWEPQDPGVYFLDAAAVGTELEAFAPSPFFGPMDNPRVVFAATDWSGRRDVTSAWGLRTRSAPGIGPLHGDTAETILALPLTNVPTIDGSCDVGGGEYDGSDQGSNANITFYLGRRDEIQYVYACVQVTADGTSNALDWGELVFDTNHDGGSTPQADDRRFRVFGGSSVLIREKGDGTGWTSCGSDCDPGDQATGAFTNGEEVYEFRIRYSDVWGTNSPSGNQRAGFAIQAHNEDASADYTWGSTNVDENVPNTWGHIDIPELPGFAFLAAVAGAVFARRRRRPANP